MITMSRTNSNDRLDWLDVARGGSIFMVVLYHTILYLNVSIGLHPVYAQLCNLLYPIRMPMFFAVSGLLAGSAICRDWRQLVSQRIINLAYIFILWSVLYWLFYRYGTGNMRYPEMGNDVKQLVKNLYQPSTSVWFLWALIFYTIIAKSTPQNFRPLVLGASLALSMTCFGGMFDHILFSHNSTMQYSFFFLFACWHGKDFFRLVVSRHILMCLIAIPAYLVFYFLCKSDNTYLVGALNLPLSIAGIVIGTSASVIVTSVSLLRKFFTYLGRNTLQIFVAHDIALAILGVTLAPMTYALPMVGRWIPIPTTILAIAIPLVLKLFLDFIDVRCFYQLPTGIGQKIVGFHIDVMKKASNRLVLERGTLAMWFQKRGSLETTSTVSRM